MKPPPTQLQIDDPVTELSKASQLALGADIGDVLHRILTCLKLKDRRPANPVFTSTLVSTQSPTGTSTSNTTQTQPGASCSVTATSSSSSASASTSAAPSTTATATSATASAQQISRKDVICLIRSVSRLLLKEQTLMEISSPVVICGDLHGQYNDFLTILDDMGHPPKTRYLFLGDYVDRGDQSLELILYLYVMKIMYPGDVFLLRGNHETGEVNSNDGFKIDCLNEYDLGVWETFLESFKCLPLAAIVGNQMMCMHGGISPAFVNIDDLRLVPRPFDIPDSGLVCDILWADPLPDDEVHTTKNCGYSFNAGRSTSVYFCQHAVDKFLAKNKLIMIVRGHEMYETGYSIAYDGKLVTIFTAPCYCGGSNLAAVMDVQEDMSYKLKTYNFFNSTSGQSLSPFVDEKTKRESVKDKQIDVK